MPNSKLAGDVSYQTPLAFVEVQVIPKYTLAICIKTPSIGLEGLQVRVFLFILNDVNVEGCQRTVLATD